MTQFFKIKNNGHFTEELPVDESLINSPRQVHNACFSNVETKQPLAPEMVHYSNVFIDELGIEINNSKDNLGLLSGANKFPDFSPYAMCYGGHQFGHWAGQLGDGRAINIAEADLNGKNWKFQLKGAGPTPYSRNADGLAVLRSSVREYLCSEAMHHLGVPTTRAMSLVKTGDLVPRDMLYNGNVKNEPGAVVCRVSPSFIRFGSFQIFAARNETDTLKKLVDYT
ncbi:MAG: protein adenylyltransferase SelO family protein, partial [Flavobacteriales bacterium]